MFTFNSTASLARQVEMHGRRSDRLNFPSTRSVLWDPKPKGKSFNVHPTQFRNCSVTFEEQTLRLAHRLSQDCTDATYRCSLQGSVYRQPDGEGMCVCVERMDFNRHSNTCDLKVPGEVTVPFELKKNGTQVDMVSSDDYVHSIREIQEHCSKKEKIELSRFVSLRASGSCCLGKDSISCSLDVDLIMAETTFQATPINAVPIVPSALSKNLSGPVSLSELQGEPKTGYLTMDQTRKLLLVLESDPKAATLPLLGIWISGVAAVYDCYVWAACLRYLHNVTLQDRVCVPPEHFLVVVYSPLHSKPEFYEFSTCDGKPDLQVSLFTSHTVLTLPSGNTDRPSSPIELELERVTNGDKANLFHAALHATKSVLEYKRKPALPKPCDNATTPEDITPRNIPAPHFAKAQVAKPSVPEVSLLYDDNEPNKKVPTPTAKPMDHLGKFVSSKTVNSQIRDPTRGPLKPINRTTSGPTDSSTKAGINSQVLQPNVQQANMPSYPNYIPGHTVQPGGVPPHRGTYPQLSPNMLGHYSIQGGHQHLPITGPYPHPGYQGYSRPVYQQQAGYYGNGYPVSHGYPVVTMHNAQINSSQVQLSVPQGQPHQIFAQPQGINPVGQSTSLIHPQPSAFTPPSPQTSRPELQPTPNVGQYHLQQHVSQNQQSPVQKQIQEPNLPGKDSSRVSANISQPGTPGSLPSRSQSASLSTPHCSPTQVTGIPSQYPQQSSTSTSPIHPTTGTQSSNSSSTSPGNVSHTSLGSGSSQVPPEVLQLLQHQDQQLRELKEQLAALLSKQNDTPEQGSDTRPPRTKNLKTTATQMSAAQSPVKSKPAPREVCTAATNTSMWYPRDTLADQTSRTHNGSTETNDSGRGSNQDSWQTINNTADLEQHDFTGGAQSRTTQAEQQSHHLAKNNPNNHSPPLGSFDGKRPENDSPGRTISDNISLNDIHLAQIPHQAQEESMMSQMIVDMPEYTSLSPDKLGEENSSGFNDSDDGTRSPQIGESVSMYDEQTQYKTYGTENRTMDDTGLGNSHQDASLLFKNQKVFYENLIGNIKRVLHNSSGREQNDTNQNSTHNDSNNRENVENTTHGSSFDSPRTPDRTRPVFNASASANDQSVDIAEITRRQLKKLGVDIDGLSSNDTTLRGEQSLFMLDHMLPRINYTSLMLDSDSDVSADADALAMKYLSDDQLAELAKLRLRSPSVKSARGHRTDVGLERLLSSTTVDPSPGVSMYGMPANNMSFATKKFLEKYGLATGVKSDVETSLYDAGETTVDATNDDQDATNASLHDVKNVKDVLHRLVHKRFLENGSFCEVTDDKANSFHQSGMTYENRTGNRQYSTTSDTTQYRTPEHTEHETYEKASSDHTPVRVFDESFRRRHRVRPFGPQDIIKPMNTTESTNQDDQKPGRQILDIERLKGLPKLL